MIFTNKILQIRVLCRHLSSTLVINSVSRGLFFLGYLLDILLSKRRPILALFEELSDVNPQGVVWRHLRPFIHTDDMIAKRREERLRNFAVLQRIGYVLKLLNHITRTVRATETTSAACRARIFRVFLCKGTEVATLFQHSID